jgi:hypothetical protein
LRLKAFQAGERGVICPPLAGRPHVVEKQRQRRRPMRDLVGATTYRSVCGMIRTVVDGEGGMTVFWWLVALTACVGL